MQCIRFGDLDRFLLSYTITEKIFETNSSFHVKVDNGKSLVAVFLEFFASINETVILTGILGTRLAFYEV